MRRHDRTLPLKATALASLGLLMVGPVPPACAQDAPPELRLDLPRIPAPARKDAVTVRIARDGALAIGDKPVGDGDLVAAVSETGHGKTSRIIIRADRRGSFERVERVMALLRAAGFDQIALVSEPSAN